MQRTRISARDVTSSRDPGLVPKPNPKLQDAATTVPARTTGRHGGPLPRSKRAAATSLTRRPIQPVPTTVPELAEALFCSSLQPSQAASPQTIAACVAESLTRYGGATGCACEVAARYGDDQALAAARMRWCLRTITATYGSSAAA